MLNMLKCIQMRHSQEATYVKLVVARCALASAALLELKITQSSNHAWTCATLCLAQLLQDLVRANSFKVL